MAKRLRRAIELARVEVGAKRADAAVSVFEHRYAPVLDRLAVGALAAAGPLQQRAARIGHDMIVGDDVPIGRDNHAGPLAILPAGRNVLEHAEWKALVAEGLVMDHDC